MTLTRFRIRWIALAVAVVLVALGVVLAVQTRSEPSIPRLVLEHATAPSLNLKTLDEKPITSAQMRNKTYVVNFFNSWCIPCPVLVDPQGSAALDYGTTGQPETYVIAPDGVVVCGTLGPSTVAALNTWLDAARSGQECT